MSAGSSSQICDAEVLPALRCGWIDLLVSGGTPNVAMVVSICTEERRAGLVGELERARPPRWLVCRDDGERAIQLIGLAEKGILARDPDDIVLLDD